MRNLIPLLLATSVVLPSEAEACSPALGHLVGTAPYDGQSEVPRDAALRAFLGEGYVDRATITVTADGAEVAGSSAQVIQTLDMVEQFSVVTFTPDEPLAEGATIEMVVELENGTEAVSFSVGTRLVTPVDGMADLEVDRLDEESPQGMMSSCDYSRWRELDATVYPGQADDDGLSLLHVFRVGEDFSGVPADEPFRTLVLDAESDAPIELQAEYPVDADEPADCFVVVQEDGAGNWSEASDVVCKRTGALGCATVTGTGAGWLGALLSLGLVFRRRRDA